LKKVAFCIRFELIFATRDCKVSAWTPPKSCNFILERMDEAEGEVAGQWDGGFVPFQAEKYHQPAP
jgi:hypothetical protein